MNEYFVYILASKKKGTLYVGVTNDLRRRVSEHKGKIIKGFTAKYGVSQLVWYESTNSIESAILKEKQLKGGSRAQKIAHIEKMNPKWEDMYYQL